MQLIQSNICNSMKIEVVIINTLSNNVMNVEKKILKIINESI